MEQLGDLRVEPVEIERIGVEQPGDRVRVGDVGRERHVVPERVPAVDAAVERQERGARPLGGDDQRQDSRHRQLDGADGRRRQQIGLLGLPPVGDPSAGAHQHRLESQRPASHDQTGRDQQYAVEHPEQAEQLRDHDQDADGEDRVGQQGGRPGPAGEDGAARRPACDRHREDDGHQAEHTEYVIADAAHRLVVADPPG